MPDAVPDSRLQAKAIAKQSVLLCFDEIQIPDIGTAALLYRLFKHLQVTKVAVGAGCVWVGDGGVGGRAGGGGRWRWGWCSAGGGGVG